MNSALRIEDKYSFRKATQCSFTTKTQFVRGPERSHQLVRSPADLRPILFLRPLSLLGALRFPPCQ